MQTKSSERIKDNRCTAIKGKRKDEFKAHSLSICYEFKIHQYRKLVQVGKNEAEIFPFNPAVKNRSEWQHVHYGGRFHALSRNTNRLYD